MYRFTHCFILTLVVHFLDVDDDGGGEDGEDCIAAFRPVASLLALVVCMASWLLLESRAGDCSVENHTQLRRLEWPMMFQRRGVGVKDRTLRMGSEVIGSDHG
mmetsp:Transcript_5152/g.14596  ORF Transcript_5152/g.14596 Transcript_5152/m.14596 type:complete len:103 (+) Transcript_5152:35-343(+)